VKRFCLSIVLFLIASFVSCTKDKIDINYDQDRDLSVAAVKAGFKKPASVTTNSRILNDRFGELEPIWELAKEEKTSAGNKCLEVPLKYPNEIRQISNLGKDGAEDLQINPPKLCMVVYLQNGERVTTIKEINPSIEYNRKYRGRIIKESFSGNLFVWSWSGELIGGSFYENGKRLGSISPIKSNESLRIEGVVCDTYTTCSWYATCNENGTNEFIYYSTTTFSSGSSCFPPGNNNHGGGVWGCTSWEKTSSNSYTQCYNTPDPEEPEGPGDGEGSGPSEVDTFQGFPQNPINNQKFTYTNPSGNRTTFTYNSEFKLWMLPEVTFLLARGGQVNLNAPLPPSYNGQVLAAIAAVALPEPTPVGEIVLAGAAVVVTSMYIYDQFVFANYLREHPHLGKCINEYVNCRSEWAFITPCDDCLNKCRAQGSWDYNLCPN